MSVSEGLMKAGAVLKDVIRFEKCGGMWWAQWRRSSRNTGNCRLRGKSRPAALLYVCKSRNGTR